MKNFGKRGIKSKKGFIYLSLLLAIIIIGIATATLVPLWSTMVKGEKEEELLFRQAISRYYADHKRYPQDLKDLLDDRTQLQPRRYLRRIYPDPMTGKTDWKLDLVVDRTKAISGIKDIHSSSNGKPLKSIQGKNGTYSDW